MTGVACSLPSQVAAKIYPPQGCMCNFCKRQCRTTLNMPSPLDIHLLDESQPVERGGRTRRGLAALPKETSSDASQPFGEEAGEDGAEGGSCASGEASSTSSFSNESQQEPAPEEAYIHRFSLATLGKNRSLRNAASKTPQNRATSLPHTPIDKGIGQRQQSYSDGSFERLSQHFQVRGSSRRSSPPAVMLFARAEAAPSSLLPVRQARHRPLYRTPCMGFLRSAFPSGL